MNLSVIFLSIQSAMAQVHVLPEDEEVSAIIAEKCDSSPAKCTSLGRRYLTSLGVGDGGNHTHVAKGLFEYACTEGFAEGCTYLGMFYDQLDRNPHLAIPLYSKGCDGGSPYACNNLGFVYLFDTKVKRNLSAAESLFSKACEGGMSTSCSYLKFIQINRRSLSTSDETVDAICLAEPSQCRDSNLTSLNSPIATQDSLLEVGLQESVCDNEVSDCGQAPKSFQGAVSIVKGAESSSETVLHYADDKCSEGDLYACLTLAQLYDEEFDIPYEKRRKRVALERYNELLEPACQKGDALACYNVARKLEKEEMRGYTERRRILLGYESSPLKSLEYYQKSADLGHTPASIRMGINHIIFDQYEKGMSLILHQCENGEENACRQAQEYLHKDRMIPTGPYILKNECQDNLPECSELVQKILETDREDNTHGLDESVKLAIEIFELGCQEGMAEECYLAAGLYEDAFMNLDWKIYIAPQTIDNLYQKGMDNFEQACSDGDEEQCFSLGYLYQVGYGTEINLVTARELYAVSCKGGEPKACNNLALFLQEEDTKKSVRQANRLLRRACKDGCEEACNP